MKLTALTLFSANLCNLRNLWEVLFYFSTVKKTHFKQG